MLPVVTPQTTVCSVNFHIRISVGTSVQVTVVWLVVVGQLPQFDVLIDVIIDGKTFRGN